MNTEPPTTMQSRTEQYEDFTALALDLGPVLEQLEAEGACVCELRIEAELVVAKIITEGFDR